MTTEPVTRWDILVSRREELVQNFLLKNSNLNSNFEKSNYLIQVTCNLCQPTIRVFNATKHATTSLLKHLPAEHSWETPKIVAKIPKLSTASNQSTIDFGNTSEVKSTEFENLLKKFIIHNDIPLLLAEFQSFRNLVRNLNSRIHIPSRKSFKNDIMKEHLDTKSVIEQQLSNVLFKILLALDIWTSDTMQRYLAITYHFVVPDGYLFTRLLDFKHLPGSHFQTLVNEATDMPNVWSNNKKTFTILHKMALDFLANSSRSTSVERKFSSSGQAVTPLRNRLNTETVRAIQCLNCRM